MGAAITWSEAASEAASEALGKYRTTAEVAERYRTSESTVRYWRYIGYGPKGVKVGRRVLYADSELDRFDASLVAGTAETAGGGAA